MSDADDGTVEATAPDELPETEDSETEKAARETPERV